MHRTIPWYCTTLSLPCQFSILPNRCIFHAQAGKGPAESTFGRAQTIHKPKGGVGGPAGPSTSDRKSATCAAIFVRFRQKSLPYTNERPGERLAVRPVSECISSTKCLWHFVDTLDPAESAFGRAAFTGRKAPPQSAYPPAGRMPIRPHTVRRQTARSWSCPRLRG